MIRFRVIVKRESDRLEVRDGNAKQRWREEGMT